jgi:hypothetical protein
LVIDLKRYVEALVLPAATGSERYSGVFEGSAHGFAVDAEVLGDVGE